MKLTELKAGLLSGAFDIRLADLYSAEKVKAQRERYAALCDEFLARYGDLEGVAFYSVPGRSEISGNHTDHNRGKVMAASIDLDIIAVAAPTDDGFFRVASVGFKPDDIDLSRLDEYKKKPLCSAALVAGCARGLAARGYKVGAIAACTTSNVMKGSGLSSSAAFEVMCVNLQNRIYNNGRVSAVEAAQISQYAENEFFGKPCGLMDQTACAVGGFITIDFADPASPVVDKLPFDLAAHGYSLCIVDTGGSHADLGADYASVPAEMKSVARFLGREVLRETTRDEIIGRAAQIRKECGDRALLRALHFHDENERVDAQRAALAADDLASFLDGVIASGASSQTLLQNVFTVKDPSEQGLTVALDICRRTLSGRGAWRVHGGGFAGTVQAYVPTDLLDSFRSAMERVFGEGSVYVLRVRAQGAIAL